MSFSLVYLGQRFVYRIWRFFHDWYAGGFRVIGGKVVSALETLDRTWAFRITLRNIFKPLYGDRSFLGSILGFFFRSGRLLAAGVIYLCVIAVGIAVYLGWAAIPLYIIDKGFF